MGQSIVAIMPEFLMTIFGLMLIVIDIMSKDEKKSGVGYFGIAFILIVLLVTVPVGGFKITGFENMLVWDTYSFAFFIIFAIAYILSTLGSVDYLKSNEINKGEYYIIMFFSIIGMMFM
ncbi:MAG: NADH-quinone oxidoreductase subunit N, partial [Deferribacterales bacterium]|nr:NADH-quinone oxidoreductase subunit N [Deferribacterales bacterium]